MKNQSKQPNKSINKLRSKANQASIKYQSYFNDFTQSFLQARQTSHSRHGSQAKFNQQIEQIIKQKPSSRRKKSLSRISSPASHNYLSPAYPLKQKQQYVFPTLISNLSLDPRDQKITLPFRSTLLSNKRSLARQDIFEKLKDQLRSWLVDVVELVTSISFNFLKNEKLVAQEMKNFAAKNILDNIKNFFASVTQMPLQKRYALVQFTNMEIQTIFQQIAVKYPQATRKGISKRLRSTITKTDIRQSNEFDFLTNSGLSFSYREDADYSVEIMKVINKLVSCAGDVFSQQDPDLSSNFQTFSELIQFIVQNVSHESVKMTYQQAVDIVRNKKTSYANLLPNFLKNTVQGMLEVAQQLPEIKKSSRSFGKQVQKNVQIGQKIPANVQLYTDAQITGGQFKAHDSSIIRLLTKWAQQLQKNILNPQDSIYRRLYKFKDRSGKEITLNALQKQALFDAVSSQIPLIRQYLAQLQSQNYYMQSLFFQDRKEGKYVHRDVDVSVMAAKINEISSQYIFKYINKLIHSLLSIPGKAAKEIKNERDRIMLQSVNLVTLKIGDLLRGKCACSQQDFIRIFTVLQQMTTDASDVLRIVRVKNRLQQSNNDVLINLFFAGKLQCQLQLSVAKNVVQSQKINHSFSHFLYEVIRAQLGPLAQLGTIIVQHDPLAKSYSKNEYYGPVSKCPEAHVQLCQLKIKQRKQFKKSFKKQINIELPFICDECSRLSIIHNPDFLFREQNKHSLHCNQCRVQQLWTYFKQNHQNESLPHILSHNNMNENDTTFCMNHLQPWDCEQFIKQIQNCGPDQVPNRFFPQLGYAINFNNKKPFLQLFNCFFHQPSQKTNFYSKKADGSAKLLGKIDHSCQRTKYVQNIRKICGNWFMIQIKGVSRSVSNGKITFKCNKKDCCGLTHSRNEFMTRNQIVPIGDRCYLNDLIESQKTVIYASKIEAAIDKIAQVIDSRTNDEKKRKKTAQNIKCIQAYQSKINDLMELSRFSNLVELNISLNPGIINLKGLQCCRQIKILNCRSCNIQSIKELQNLKSLQYLDLGENKGLQSLHGLQSHSALSQLSLRQTSIQSVGSLRNCSNIQFLDLSECWRLSSIKDIVSLKLAYLNIAGCLQLTFDLPLNALKSCKSLQIIKQQQQSANLALQLIMKTITRIKSNLNESKSQIEQEKAYQQMVDTLNNILKSKNSLIQGFQGLSWEQVEPDF